MRHVIVLLLVGFLATSYGLGIDKAAVRIVNNATQEWAIEVGTVSDRCCDCLSGLLDLVLPGAGPSQYHNLDTAFGILFTFTDVRKQRPLGSSHQHFGEHGWYTMVLSDGPTEHSVVVQVIVDQDPDDTYRPLWTAGACLVGMALVGTVLSYAHGAWRERKRQRDADDLFADNAVGERLLFPGEGQSFEGQVDRQQLSVRPPGGRAINAEGKSAGRVQSLDVFRGLCLSIMVFVNYSGGSYWFFAHSAWNGLTVADVVFPSFIWMMGASMTLSLSGSRNKEGVSRWSQLVKAFRRACILFALGIVVSNFVTAPQSVRIPGVLQRFGVSFLVVALILILVPKHRGEDDGRDEEGDRWLLADITHYVWDWLVIVLLVAAHLLITFLLPVPGCPKGYLGPGGIGDQGQYRGCTGGAAGYIDRTWLTSHMYSTPTCLAVYGCSQFDPEGILGVLNSIAMTYLGVQAGRILVFHGRSPASVARRWLVWGVVCGSAALALCQAKQDGGVIPINKNLWSLSFILAVAGIDFVFLALAYYVVDQWKLTNGAPFLYVGKNSILVYCASEVLKPYFPFSWLPNSLDDLDHAFVLTQNLVAVGLFSLFAWWLHAHRFYLKV